MNKKGFTLIELLIAIGLSALFLPALVFVFSFSLGAASQGENYTYAYALAQENMEAVYYLKENGGSEWDWANTPENTPDGWYYQPEKSGGWSLSTITDNPQPNSDGSTVTVRILPVEREIVGEGEIGDIVPEGESGEVDLTTRKIIVDVTWKEKGIPTDIELVSYVSRH